MENFTEMKKEFDRDGYFLMRDFMGGDEAAEISRQIDRFIAEVLPTRSETLAFYEVKDQPETIMRLQNMEGHDEFFKQLLNSDRFVSLASKLLGDNVVAKNVQWFNKPARVGSPTPTHQDGFYFMLRPNEAVTLWLALDLVDEGNGCVRYVSGSNREGMRPHQRSNVIGFSQGITDYGDPDRERETPILAAPGDLFAHHCMTIHRADANTSERPRAALGFVYNAARAAYDSEAAATYLEQLYQQWEEEGKL